ncbi:glycoside hydrolase family 13 protein [Lacticaseibacillus mingshuiensis]|uniref:Glycoside hydrolase family 13 protein n=1 Tax=Lacticaseibacillus mingshuiensis TaxID=2799574 RepID=A0ABW4CHH2_9LACO|nr:glycoside hydrolase family 13 protein [Lacticaseibacillus mingshuiensis]
MELAALRHRPESEDAFLYDPTHMRVRLHAKAGDVAGVSVLFNDPNWFEDRDGKMTFIYHEKTLVKLGTGQLQDYWGTTLTAPYRRLQYLFVVTGTDGTTTLFGDRGTRADSEEERQELGNYFRMPYFHQIDRVKTPDWVKETVWYQIFPERFANGDKANDPAGTKPWQPSDHPGREDYYGGDLQGVLDHLDDLQNLGINGLYFCPLFKASSNHKYDTIDYLEIDPDFGDKALFAKLVNEAHKRGMKVMLDAVFNHMGYASPQWLDVVENGEQSRFKDWFHIYEFPVTPYRNPVLKEGAPQFDTFAFGDNMPKLNTANPEVQDYLLTVATYWIKQFDIDAWRLDVANEVDHHFWAKFNAACKAVKPDFYILGEIWHSSQNWLNGTEFDGVMNYAFTQQIEHHFLTGKQDAKTAMALLVDQLMLYRDQTDQVMLNMLDSHDTPRIRTIAGGNEDKALQALAFTFLQTGAPCIYYGTEMGMEGDNDPDDRKPMDWSQLGQPIWQRVQQLIALRHRFAKLLGTGTTQLEVRDDGLIQVTRVLGDQTLVGLFNTTAQPVAVTVQAPAYTQQFGDGALLPLGVVVSIS